MYPNVLDVSGEQARPLDPDRLKRLMDELAFAIGRTDRTTLKTWGGRSAGRLVTLTGRRIGALSGLVGRLAQVGSGELKGFLAAMREGRFGQQLGDRTAAAIDGSLGLARDGARLVSGIGQGLLDDPKTNAPRVLAAFLGFYAGSGGVDGDGGIPDLDLLAGIDAHRSILTHSILAGVVAEGLLLALVDLAGEINDRLPRDHDVLWDTLAEVAEPLTQTLATGMSAGIAYHLLWDAGIEPAPYKDLPFSMPMEGHEAVMAANGTAEGAYAANRMEGRGPVTVDQSKPEPASTGRKVVNGIAEAADKATQYGRDLWGRFGGNG